MTYADQGRHDLATLTLNQADLCVITDPIYRNQLNGLVTLYTNWSDIEAAADPSRSDAAILVQQLLSEEHGIATDIAADMSSVPIKLKERWKYEPLVFSTPSSTNYINHIRVEIFPNPAYDVLNINVKGIKIGKDLKANIIRADGKVMSILNINMDFNNIDITSLNSGVYTVELMEHNKIVFVSKFIKIQ